MTRSEVERGKQMTCYRTGIPGFFRCLSDGLRLCDGCELKAATEQPYEATMGGTNEAEGALSQASPGLYSTCRGGAAMDDGTRFPAGVKK